MELFINLKINTFIDYAVLIKSMSQTYFKVIFKIVGKDPQLAFVIYDHPDYEFMFKANNNLKGLKGMEKGVW